MQKISILKVENPSCLWGRVISGPGGDTKQYDNLLAHINLFYHGFTQDMQKLKPTSIEKGQVCMVYWSVMRLWCRALIESIITDSVACQALCFLVDYGERLIVPYEQIRVAVQKFLQLPFWVRKFHLAGIKPTTLRVSVYEEKAEITPSIQWDSSATLYLHNLLQASTQAEGVLLESDTDSTSIELYLTAGNIKICVNDDLVAKNFACYSRESADGSGLEEGDKFPVTLSSRILTQTILNKPLTETQPFPVTKQDPAADGAGDWMRTLSTCQSQQHELKTPQDVSRSKVTEEQPSLGCQSKNGSETAESDSAEDTDSALGAALTKNLSLFRLQKFLNPDTSYQPAAHSVSQHKETPAASSTCTGQELLFPSYNYEPASVHEDILPSMSGAEGLCASSQVEDLGDEEESSFSRSEESPPAAAEKTWNSEEDWACSCLLEWLNPEPVIPDPDAADDVAFPSDPSRDGILVHSAYQVEPCTSLDDAPITDALRWGLRKKQYSTLSPAECYSWPAMARGCNTVVISHNADQPLSYLAPFLSHILLNSIFASITCSNGPIAVLLCPGWEKVQAVYDLLEEMKVTQTLHPHIVLLGVGKDEAKAVRIPKNCLLLVTTPFSLVRLLSCHCFLFLRLYHLVLDEADQLFTLAPDQMATILQHFQKVTGSEKRASFPQQIIAMAKRWNSHMEGLLTNHMPYSCIVIAVPEEAALYGNVQQIILMTVESSKISVLLAVLDFNPKVGQKTLIVADSAQEVEDVFKAVSHKSAFCLKSHEGLAHEFDFVIQEWRKDIGPSTHVILATTNKCLQCLGIRDATCVVHYSFPTSPKVFGSRLYCVAEKFRNLSERVPSQSQVESCPPLTKSVLLISERNARHVVGVLRYLVRTNAPLPPELLSFAQGIHMAREDQKTNSPFCSSLKSFGVCSDSAACPARHRFISQLDQSALPASGVIEVVPLHIKTASVFCGRIVRKDDGFQSLASEMTSYFADNKRWTNELLEGGLYAVQEDEVFHRVKILSVPERGDRLFFSVLVRFIDVGKEEEVKAHQILQLPEKFHSLPDQAVEIIVCCVKPCDSETKWHPKVTRAVGQKIRGLQHRARAVFSLGNTVFVDPMVRVTQVPGMKTVINEYNIQSEILDTGMAVSNPEHLDLLKTLVEESKTSCGMEAGLPSGSGDSPASLLVGTKAEEEALAEAFRAAQSSQHADPPQLEPCEPFSPASPENHSIITAPPAAETHLNPICDEKSLLVGQATIEENTHTADLSFHPQVSWHQTSDSVIVTVKLMNLESQRCDFYPDRVVYSGRVAGRTYSADLQLHSDIVVDRCCWEMKSNEPVLKLVKKEKGSWEKLLRNKNIFVSYNMDYLEEDEHKTPNGLWFVEDTGQDNWYVNSESDSESN